MRSLKSSLLLVALMLAVSLVVGACTVPVAPVETGDAAAPAEEMAPIKVGLVTDVGRINDRSFNQSAWEGVQLAAEQLGLAEEDVKYHRDAGRQGLR